MVTPLGWRPLDYPGDPTMLSPIGRGVSRVLALLLGLALALGLSAAADARKPVRPSAPTDLAIGTITMSGGSYVVPATWKAGANTTSFLGTVTGGGATLATASLTGTSWSPSITAKAGTTVTVTIVGVNGRFKSAGASASKVLPDVTAPVGAYQATWGDPVAGTATATFTQVSLTDDASVAAGIQVVVDFGDGSATFATNGGQATITHDYTIPDAQPHRFQPQIILKDAAGNSSNAAVNAVVVNDTTAPAGSATLSRSTGWARWTTVSIATTAMDNVSPVGKVKRRIDWGDGRTTTTYGNGAVRHVYAAAGTYSPTVRFEDEALPANASTAPAPGAVTIRADVYRPSVTLTLPRTKLRSVRSWKVLRGTAADGQTAVRIVRVKAVEKRAGAYYAYVPATRTWVKAGRKARAFAKAGEVKVATSGAWSVRLPRLTKGVLVYRAVAVDAMGNVSSVSQHRQRLTRR